MDDIHEQGAKSHRRVVCRAMGNVEQLGAKHEYDVGVEPGEYMLGVRGGLQQMSKQ